MPQSLMAERDELAGKRDTLKRELDHAKSELEALRRRSKHRSA